MEAQAAVITKNVNLNTGGGTITGIVKGQDRTGSLIYFGSKETPILWRTMSTDSSATPAAGTITLLADDSVADRKYDSSNPHKWCGTQSDFSDASEICRWLNGYNGFTTDGFLPSRFTTIEKNSIQSEYSTTSEYGYNNTNPFTPNQPIVLPSVGEANGWFSSEGSRILNDDYWWLRSPGSANYAHAAYVISGGHIISSGANVWDEVAIRPAFNLNLSSVLFSSASGMSRAGFAVIDSSQVSANTWKLTLQDGNNGFVAVRTDDGDLSENTQVDIHVSSLGSTGSDYKLSAMLVDSEKTVLCYGYLDGGSAAATGDYSLTIPTGITTGDKLYVFAEQINSGNLTDYASNMVDVSVYAPVPTPTPVPVDNKADNSSTQSSSTKKSENTYVNPLSWTYAGTKADSLCTIEKQGLACQTIFKANTPAGYTEGFSFNLSTKENGVMKTSYSKKTGKLVLYLPKEYQKSGRITALLGIDKSGNVKFFADEDTNDSTMTVSLNNIEGYAFSFIYTDAGAASKTAAGTTVADTGNIYTVKSGDVLSRIAENLKVSRKHLTDKNSLTNPDKLSIGQKIYY